jgi:hypothetical protein
MTNDSLLPFDLPAVHAKKLTVDFDGGNQSSDGGALLLRQAEKRLGICKRLAAAMPDRRDPNRISHEMIELITARTIAICCGHEDGNDFDSLRHDPLMKLAVGRCPETGAPLASQSTISRIECSLQSDPTPTDPKAMRQEIDIRYVVTNLEGTPEHLYETIYCQRGQMENLIKLHKAQLASDRTSCMSATANQVRLVLHTAAFWLMHAVRAAIPKGHALAKAEFATIRNRLIKVGARVIEHTARIRIHLPTSCPERALFRQVALGLLPAGP